DADHSLRATAGTTIENGYSSGTGTVGLGWSTTFVRANVTALHAEAFDTVYPAVGGLVSWQVPADTRRRAWVCPYGRVRYDFGPKIAIGGVDLEGRTLAGYGGIGIGVVAAETDTAQIAPTVGAA